MKIKFKHINYLFTTVLILLVGQPMFAQKLQSRELNPYPINFEIKHKVIFEKNQPFLIIAVPAYNYKLSLRVYTDYPKKASMIWMSEPEFKDSITHLVHKIALDISLREFAVDIRIVNSNNKVLFSDINYVKSSDPTTQIYLTDIDGMPLLENYLKSDQSFKINHNSDSVLKFFVKYYKDEITPAPPPSSQNSGFINAGKLSHDGLFTLNRGRELKLSEEGLYYIQLNSEDNNGIFVNYFGEDYPVMNRVEDLILATRYITTKDEYNRMTDAASPKKALDEYWLARNKNEVEAKRLISLYYNRMKECNRLFSYAKEGWKTDQGMIYTIFGAPDIVRKFPDRLVWYYSHDAGRYPVEFVFVNYSGQFVLDRSSELKEPWNAQIIKWRFGKLNK